MWQILFEHPLRYGAARRLPLGHGALGALVCVVVCVGLLWSVPASAQDGVSVKILVKRAGQYYRQGKQLAIQRKFGLALRAYQRALKSVKRAQRMGGMTPKLRHIETTMLYIIARTFEYRQQWCSASNFYRRCLRRRPRPSLAAKATRGLAALKPRLRFVVQLSSSPPGASFSIRSLTAQDEWRRIASRAVVGCGSFRVQARLAGHRSQRKTLDTFGPAPSSMTFLLEPLQAATPSRTNGGSIVQPGKKPQPRRWPRIVGWSSLAAAALMGVGGIILVGVARSEFADVESKVGDPLESLDLLKAQRDRGVNLQNTGFVFWGLSAVAGGVAAWAFLSQRKSSTTTPPSDSNENSNDNTVGLLP